VTFALFCLGFFLCLLSGKVLWKMRRTTLAMQSILDANGILEPLQLPFSARAVPVVWWAVFLAGVSVVAWAWLR
jgi:hypothetical protein